MHGSVADLIDSIVYPDARTDFIPDSLERRNRMRRRAAIPSQCTESASGPITAMDLIESFFSGKNASAFFSSTTDSRGIFSEMALSFSVFHGSGESLIFE